MFACNKVRRSLRLGMKEMTQIKIKTIEDGPLGYFSILPLELKFFIFSFLNIEDLSLVALTSKQFRNIIEVYRCSNSAKQLKCHIPIHENITSHTTALSGIQYFKKLGLLIKRSTCLYATKERLKIIERMMMKHMCMYSNCKSSQCFSLIYFGKMFTTIIAGWDETECQKALMFLPQSPYANMWKYLGAVVRSKPGSQPELESQVRYFFRRVFLDPAEREDEKCFWLRSILEGWPMVHQAKLLYILYGPHAGGKLQWDDLCENTVANRNQLYVYFSELGSAFQMLHESRQWTDDAVISVMDELTNLPEEWLSENVAALLFITGSSLSTKVLGSKAINGRIHDISTLVTSLCLVHVKAGKNLSNVITLMNQLCHIIEHPSEKIRFLTEVVSSFKEVLLDFYEYDQEAEGNFTDMTHIVDAQTKFMEQLIYIAFLPQSKMLEE